MSKDEMLKSIRDDLHKDIDQAELDKAMREIAHLKGAGKKKRRTSDEEIHRIRERVFEEFDKKFR